VPLGKLVFLIQMKKEYNEIYKHYCAANEATTSYPWMKREQDIVESSSEIQPSRYRYLNTLERKWVLFLFGIPFFKC